jgi:hypothetical protein
MVAQINGTSMEVQNQQSGQVTVNWTSSTTFTKTVTVTAASVAAGDCVTITGSTSSGQLTANNVTISQPDSSGNCNAGRFGGSGGGGFPGGGGSPPNGGTLPSRPSGSFPGGASGFSFASGKVTSLSATSLVIYGISSAGFSGGAQGSTPPTSIKDSNVTVGLSSSTRYNESQTVTSSTLAVGDCVTAVGSTDSTGAVSARTVRITSTGAQSCTSGFGPPGGGTNG